MQRSSNSSSSDERLVFHLVIGAHTDTPIPDEVFQHGLTHRFAVIVDPYSQSAAACETTARVLTAIFAEIAHEFASSRIVATMLDGTEYRELRDMADKILGDEELHLPRKIHYYNEQTLVCLEYTELWCEVGGPQPYSDSVTLSFYTPSDLTLRLIHACERVCAHHPAVLGEFYGSSITWLGRRRPLSKALADEIKAVGRRVGALLRGHDKCDRRRKL